jgi:hypothetical protein
MSALAHSLAKTTISGVNPLLSPLALLLSAPCPSCQIQAFILELFHLKNEAPTGTGGRAELHEMSVPRKAFSDKLAASDTTWELTAAHRRPTFIPSLGQLPSRFH